jgi:UDP-2,3-diacylglucosamine pyrophosphatase LpxH
MACPDTQRTIWLSDIHLGSKACRVDLLLDFLRGTECATLYLVGDVVDLERMRRSFYWPESHTEVLRTILEKSQQGTRVVYIPGNHDDDFRALAGQMLGPIEIVRRAVHLTSDGRRLLVLHGDEFDHFLGCKSLANLAGGFAYCALLGLNRLVGWWRAMRGRPYWSLAQHVKERIPKAIRYVENFQRACIRAAREEGMDGVVCGHIHRAAIVEDDDFIYCNDGDWVESCTAIAEDASGALSLIRWAEPQKTAETPSLSLARAA